ncbi:MAG: hypothetical protein ACRDYW_03055 [Acidimicrobiales bacterium]
MSRSRASVAALALVASWAGCRGPAWAAQPAVGDAVIVSASGDRLDRGGSGTPFSLRLPDGAECAGSSEFEGWLVNSYMVHASTAPLDVAYDGLGPTPPDAGNERFRQPLFAVDTARFVSAPTAGVERKGEPGRIVDVPVFSLAVYTSADVRPGRYHLGIACTLYNEIGRVWDAQITVESSGSDEPGGFVWQVVGAEPTRSGSPAGPLLAGGALVVGFLALVRRRPATHRTSREGTA